MSYAVLACRCVLAGVFLVSLAGKLRSRTAFEEFVTATAALLSAPGRPAKVVAVGTITAEIAVVCAMVFEPSRRLGLIMAVAVLVCFTVALVRALLRGAAAPCRCFGASDTPIGIRHVIRNIVLAAVAAAAVALDVAVGTHHYEPVGIAVIVPAVAACVLLTVRLDDLVELLR
ncbi:MauE/DoxX family redox-associated membrane protein [Nocardia thraciensis]